MTSQLFSRPFYHYSQGVFGKIKQTIEQASSDQLVDPEEYIKSVVSSYRLTEINVDWDSLQVLSNHREEESFAPNAFGDETRQVTPVYTFEVEFSGSANLLNVQPSTSRMIRLEANVRNNKISFEIRGSDKSKLEQIKGGLQFNTENQKGEVGSFNTELEKMARAAVEQRKKELARHDDGLNAFGVPIKGEGE